ncbi:MAG: YgaP-like transmembrane domain [Hyphomicrobiales bacterium]
MKNNTQMGIDADGQNSKPTPRRAGWRGLSINITPAERLGRIFLGGAGAVAGAVLLASAASALAVVLEVLLVAAGVDLVVTGALGHCPLYAKLGHVPASLRRSS